MCARPSSMKRPSSSEKSALGRLFPACRKTKGRGRGMVDEDDEDAQLLADEDDGGERAGHRLQVSLLRCAGEDRARGKTVSGGRPARGLRL